MAFNSKIALWDGVVPQAHSSVTSRRNLLGLRGAMMSSRSRLPYKREVDYIESTGTQYIDTGLVHSVQSYEYEVDFTPSNNENTTAVFGSGKNGAWDGVSYNNSLYIGGSAKGRGFGRVSNVRQTIKLNVEYGIFTLLKDGDIISDRLAYSGSTINGFNILLFAYSFGNNNPTARSKQKVHYFKLTMDGVLAADYIPVIDNEDRPAFYDKVTKTMKYNAGTGEFLVP